MDVSRITSQHLIGERLDANYYGTQFLKNEAFLNKCGLPFEPIGSLAVKCNCGATPKEVNYDGAGQGLIRTSDVRPNYFAIDKVLRTSELKVKRESNVAALSNDLLYTMSGTIGYAAVIPETDETFSFSNTIARVRFPKDGPYDPRFMATFFNCKYGYKQSLRLVSGGIQGHVMPNPFKNLLVPTPHSFAQKYIGEKVRQAERLREHARGLLVEFSKLLSISTIDEALATPSTRHTAVTTGDLEPRLDAKYYDVRAMRVLKAASLNARGLHSLIESINNGFELRTFVEVGTPYITVTEVSSGRLNIDSAPRIPHSVEVPAKALINKNCVLVVRTGSIGIAIKVHAEDVNACISSHLIRLLFIEEADAAAVAAFLNSPVGRCLLHKISYGAVQPQVGQEELLKLPIPEAILDNKEVLLRLNNSLEATLRAAQRLTLAAKLLVEALIEGRVSEAELSEAQEALERGDTSAGRELLSRLTRKGIDVADEPPLFPDLDALYQALEQVAATNEQLQEA